MVRWFVDRSAQRGIPSISLRRLLPDAKFVGCRDLRASGCTSDSRRLEPGQVFVAVRGATNDGHAFVGRALERGAAGVVVERPCPEAGPLQIIVPDSREALAKLCLALAGNPAEHLLVIGVTGAVGKTATSLFLRSIFEAAGARFGLVGPFGWSNGVETRPAGPSTSAEGLAEMLAETVERGSSGSLVEVADPRDVLGIPLDAAIVTNVGTGQPQGSSSLQARRTSMARLVRAVAPGGLTVVNADDPDADLLGAVNLDARRVSFGLTRPADVSAGIDRLDASGTRFRLFGFDREASVDLRPIGKANVSHALAAAAFALAHGLATDAVVDGLEAVARVPGRLEPIGPGRERDVRVDRARTEPELRRALATLREAGLGRIHCVLGAEGLQDRAGRIGLARAAEEGADRVILTTDNPRTEDPDGILDDLLAGFRRPGRVQVEPDRRRAIEEALTQSTPAEAILIAGKGCPTVQIFADRAVRFSDQDIVTRWLQNRRPDSRRRSA